MERGAAQEASAAADTKTVRVVVDSLFRHRRAVDNFVLALARYPDLTAALASCVSSQEQMAARVATELERQAQASRLVVQRDSQLAIVRAYSSITIREWIKVCVLNDRAKYSGESFMDFRDASAELDLVRKDLESNQLTRVGLTALAKRLRGADLAAAPVQVKILGDLYRAEAGELGEVVMTRIRPLVRECGRTVLIEGNVVPLDEPYGGKVYMIPLMVQLEDKGRGASTPAPSRLTVRLESTYRIRMTFDPHPCDVSLIPRF